MDTRRKENYRPIFLMIITIYSLMYMQSTSCKMPGWMKLKLESRLLGDNVYHSTVYNSQDMEAT